VLAVGNSTLDLHGVTVMLHQHVVVPVVVSGRYCTVEHLTDEEMFAMEDIIADSFDDQDHEDEDDGGSRAVACEKVASLVVLSGRIASNASFARQVRRKYV
jgi:hypothetical protein